MKRLTVLKVARFLYKANKIILYWEYSTLNWEHLKTTEAFLKIKISKFTLKHS